MYICNIFSLFNVYRCVTILPSPLHKGQRSSSKRKLTRPVPRHSPQRTPPRRGSPGLTTNGCCCCCTDIGGAGGYPYPYPYPKLFVGGGYGDDIPIDGET